MLPEDIIIAGEYTWIRFEGNFVVVGLNEHIFYDFEEVCSVELPEVGEFIERDEDFLTVETNRGLVDIYSPISGQVMEVNEEIEEFPDLINIDPYGPGWLCIIEPDEENFTEDGEDDYLDRKKGFVQPKG